MEFIKSELQEIKQILKTGFGLEEVGKQNSDMGSTE